MKPGRKQTPSPLSFWLKSRRDQLARATAREQRAAADLEGERKRLQEKEQKLLEKKQAREKLERKLKEETASRSQGSSSEAERRREDPTVVEELAFVKAWRVQGAGAKGIIAQRAMPSASGENRRCLEHQGCAGATRAGRSAGK